MRRATHWSQLRLGAVATAAAALVALGIFFVDRVGHWLEFRYRLRVYAESARNLGPGSPVWLAGVPVGRVWAIGFQGPETPLDRRIAIDVRLRRAVQPLITEGSTVRAVSAGLLGQAVLEITPPHVEAPPLADGSALVAGDPADLPELAAKFQQARALLPDVRARWRALRARWGDAPHAAALLRNEPDGVWDPVFRNLAAFRAELARETGSLDRIAADPDLIRRLTDVAGRIDRLAAAAAGGTLGRLAADTILAGRLDSAAARAARIAARLDRADGTAGRLLHDREIWIQWERALRALHSLRAGLAATP